MAEAVAYLNNRRVSVAWNGERLVTGRADGPLEFDGEGPLLVWDLRGILKNRPAPGPLPLNPKRETLVDSGMAWGCLLYTSPSPRDGLLSRMPSSA